MIPSLITRNTLNELPPIVQKKLNETGLRAHLESLIDVLHDESIPPSRRH